MVTRTNMVLVIIGVAFALVGLFAPAVNLGAAATPVSLFDIVNQMAASDGPAAGALSLPAALTAKSNLILGLVGAIVLMAAVAFGLALFKLLRSSLLPSAVMAGVAGYLMFSLSGMQGLTVAVPDSYGWVLMIAGSMVATVTGIFALFGPGPGEKADERDTEPKDLGYMANWRPGTQSIPAKQRDAAAPAKAAKRKEKAAPAAKNEETPADESIAAGSAKREETPVDESIAAGAAKQGTKDAGSGVPPSDPATIGAMAAIGRGNEEPTESGGWVLSGFDANGMAVRLNISDLDLRISDDGILIGRNSKQCRLVLNDDSVSRRHARLSGTNPMMIEDLDSANGTVVNRERLVPNQKTPIEPGSAIEIGAVRLTLVRS